MCANCGAMSVQFKVIDKDMKFSGSVDNRIVANVGDELNIEVTFGEHSSIDDVKIDPATPLPEGLSFDGQKITGKVNKACNTFIRVIYTDDLEKVNGNTLNLTVLAVSQIDAASIENKEEKKCSMSVVAASALVSMIAMAGAALLLLRRKEN